MRLIGVALGDEGPRGLRRSRIERLGDRRRREAAEQRLELAPAAVVERLEVADDERGTRLGRPAARAEGDDPVAREGVAQMLGGAEHRAAERVVTEHRLVDEMLGHHRRLILGAGDLLDDDATLAIELLAVEVGTGDEVGEQVGGLQPALRASGDVKGDEVVAGVGVEHRADPFGALVDVAVVRILLAALEHEVLEEVGHAVLLGTLAAGPASKAARMVTARVPCTGIRCNRRPFSRVVTVISDIRSDTVACGHRRSDGLHLLDVRGRIHSSCKSRCKQGKRGTGQHPRRYAAATSWLPLLATHPGAAGAVPTLPSGALRPLRLPPRAARQPAPRAR